METSTLYNYFEACQGVTTDSRRCPEGSMFIALKGETFNGNAFAEQALAQGCRYAVVDEPQYVPADNPRILLVNNCLEALQQLAREHRRRMGTKIVGITGTNGKTTTKELIAAVLKKKYRVLYTEGNLNNHIGVPLTLLRLTREHEVAVIEMGANHPGEIRTLVHIVEPDRGLITNVGKAHLEGFGSFEGVMAAKGELYEYFRECGRTVYLDFDNRYLKKMAAGGLLTMPYGEKNKSACVTGKLLACHPYLSFEWGFFHQNHYRVDTRLIGAYNLKNALAAITVGHDFEVPHDAICEAIAGYVPTNNRSQLTETADNHLIVDAYNANPTSMAAALENFRLMEVPHKVAILGDMKELGESSTEEHRKVVSQLRKCGFERVILVGGEFRKVDTRYEHFADVEELKEALRHEKPQGKYILIKGSNSMKLSGLKEVL